MKFWCLINTDNKYSYTLKLQGVPDSKVVSPDAYLGVSNTGSAPMICIVGPTMHDFESLGNALVYTNNFLPNSDESVAIVLPLKYIYREVTNKLGYRISGMRFHQLFPEAAHSLLVRDNQVVASPCDGCEHIFSRAADSCSPRFGMCDWSKGEPIPLFTPPPMHLYRKASDCFIRDNFEPYDIYRLYTGADERSVKDSEDYKEAVAENVEKCNITRGLTKSICARCSRHFKAKRRSRGCTPTTSLYCNGPLNVAMLPDPTPEDRIHLRLIGHRLSMEMVHEWQRNNGEHVTHYRICPDFKIVGISGAKATIRATRRGTGELVRIPVEFIMGKLYSTTPPVVSATVSDLEKIACFMMNNISCLDGSRSGGFGCYSIDYISGPEVRVSSGVVCSVSHVLHSRSRGTVYSTKDDVQSLFARIIKYARNRRSLSSADLCGVLSNVQTRGKGAVNRIAEAVNTWMDKEGIPTIPVL